jgi:hypothetical protein
MVRTRRTTQGCDCEVAKEMINRARITWLPPDKNGRSALPAGRRYATISRFPGDGPEWPDGAWTIVIEFEKPPSEQGNPSLGHATFLSPDAPAERLHPGGVFELFEGLRKVADVELLEVD